MVPLISFSARRIPAKADQIRPIHRPRLRQIHTVYQGAVERQYDGVLRVFQSDCKPVLRAGISPLSAASFSRPRATVFNQRLHIVPLQVWEKLRRI